MKVNITGKRENRLLNRTELDFKVDGSAVPPKRSELRAKIAALNNVKPEQVSIVRVSHGFGATRTEGMARVYASQEALERTELPHIVARNLGKKGEKPGEKSSEKIGGSASNGESMQGSDAGSEKPGKEKEVGSEKKGREQ